jgi:hypothetical protein
MILYLRSGAEHCLLDILKGREEVQGLMLGHGLIVAGMMTLKYSNCMWPGTSELERKSRCLTSLAHTSDSELERKCFSLQYKQ